jgi:putative peptide zinc metalloprotease protein
MTADHADHADHADQADRPLINDSWRVPPGLQLLGPAQGSGIREPTYLLRRRDGQVVQVSELLHLVVAAVAPGRTPEQIAEVVSGAYGRTLTSDGLAHLVRARLQPLGLVEDTADPPDSPPPRANPLLSLTLKGTLLPVAAVRRIASPLAYVFWPPIVVAVIAGVVAVDVQIFRHGDALTALQQVLAAPALLLAGYGLLTLAAVLHEIGHAAACRYGGAQPGRIGYGVYLVFPAFYTDVTDSYRLSRAGRLRTDLGGLYFNVWFLVASGIGYLVTGDGLFLLVLLVLHLEMMQQLIPAVRFDGYYVLSDLAGVPDLFARVRPVLRSLVPGRPQDPRVTELRPAARRLVAGWVLVVVPLLAFSFGWLLWHLPVIVRNTWAALGVQTDQLVQAWQAAEVAVVLLSVISMVLLVLPLLGIAVLLWRLATLLGRSVLRMARPEQSEETVTPSEVPALPPDLMPMELSAAAFRDDTMLSSPPLVPRGGWQRAVYRVSAGTLNPGPSSSELRRAEIERRLCAPIEGSRRVVVMSRKGGVGKTTMTLALGSTFATLRGDRVVAVDANPDAGNLAHRVAPPISRTVTDLLQRVDDIQSYAELRSYVSQAPESRLEVLGSDDDPRIGMALNREAYHRLIQLLDRFYNLILLDTGTGILDSANQGLLTEADELVLVLRPGLDGGRAAALTLDWLDEHEYGELVSKAIVVINGVRRGLGVPLEPMVKHFSRRCARVVTVPWDPALETGAQTLLSSLRSDTRDSLVEMAAAVADDFQTQGARR